MRHEQATPHAVPLAGVELSVIVPAKNEAENLPTLIERLFPVLRGLGRTFRGHHRERRQHRRLAAGAARPRRVAPRDSGDRSRPQLRPDRGDDGRASITRAAISSCRSTPICRTIRPTSRSCWPNWTRATTSSPAGGRIARTPRCAAISSAASPTGVISRVSGVHLHDYGCSLKAYRRSVIGPVRLYGEMHRFVPIYAVVVRRAHHRDPGQSQPAAARQIQLRSGARLEGRAGPDGGAVPRSLDRQADLCVWRLRRCCGSSSPRSARPT